MSLSSLVYSIKTELASAYLVLLALVRVTFRTELGTVNTDPSVAVRFEAQQLPAPPLFAQCNELLR